MRISCRIFLFATFLTSFTTRAAVADVTDFLLRSVSGPQSLLLVKLELNSRTGECSLVNSNLKTFKVHRSPVDRDACLPLETAARIKKLFGGSCPGPALYSPESAFVLTRNCVCRTEEILQTQGYETERQGSIASYANCEHIFTRDERAKIRDNLGEDFFVASEWTDWLNSLLWSRGIVTRPDDVTADPLSRNRGAAEKSF